MVLFCLLKLTCTILLRLECTSLILRGIATPVTSSKMESQYFNITLHEDSSRHTLNKISKKNWDFPVRLMKHDLA